MSPESNFNTGGFTMNVALILASLAGAGESPEDVVAAVVAGIRTNYDFSERVSATYSLVSRSHAGGNSKQMISQGSSSAPATAKLRRGSEKGQTERIVVSREKLRYEYLDDDSNPIQIMTRSNGEWKVYSSGAGILEVVPTESLPGRLPIDPREYGGESIKIGLLDCLEDSQASDAVFEADEEGNEFAKVTTFRDHGEGGRTERVGRYAAAYSFLPTKIATSHDGLAISECDIRYRRIRDGMSWYPEEMTITYFRPAKNEMGARPAVTQVVTYSLVNLSVNPEEATGQDFFSIEIPAGTEVRDLVRDMTYDSELPTEPRPKGIYVVIGLAGLVVLFIAMLLVRRKTRR